MITFLVSAFNYTVTVLFKMLQIQLMDFTNTHREPYEVSVSSTLLLTIILVSRPVAFLTAMGLDVILLYWMYNQLHTLWIIA